VRERERSGFGGQVSEPFDARLASGRVRVVAAADVVDLLPVTHAPDRIAEYAEAMRRKERFPPVAVLPVLGRLLLADGHKRLAACRAMGVEEIPVEVWSLSRWLADQTDQLRRNVEKNRTIARAALDEPRVALHLAGTTVAHWRRVGRSLGALLRARLHATFGSPASTRPGGAERRGGSMKSTLLGIAAVAFATTVAAQPSNTIGPGPITPTHLPLVDTNDNGPDANDTPITIGVEGATIDANTPAGLLTVLASNPQLGTGRGLTYTITNQPKENQSLTFTTFDSMNRPTGASLSVSLKSPAVRRRPLGFSTAGTGTAALHPLNAQGYHDGVSGEGHKLSGTPISFDISFVYGTSPGQTKPDYISVPWANLMTISGQVQGGGSGGLAHQVWIPMTDTGRGAPDSITADFGPNAPSFPSPPLAPGAAVTLAVPTLSGWAMVALSLSLVLVGWLQIRRGGVSLGF
jgi:hypothetical protein